MFLEDCPRELGADRRESIRTGEGSSGEPRAWAVWEGEKGETSAGAEMGREDAWRAARQSCVSG